MLENKQINEFLTQIFVLNKKKQNNTKWKLEKRPEEVVQVFLSKYEKILDLDDNNQEKQGYIKTFKENVFSQNIIKKENIPENYWKLQSEILGND